MTTFAVLPADKVAIAAKLALEKVKEPGTGVEYTNRLKTLFGLAEAADANESGDRQITVCLKDFELILQTYDGSRAMLPPIRLD